MKTLIQIHSIGQQKCSFSGKEAEGAVVTFSNGTVKESFMSWASIKKLATFQFKETADDDRKSG